MCVSADRHPEGSRQAKVSKLDLPLGVDEEVLGLQVSMKNSVGVAEGQALQQLEKIALQNTHTKIYTQVSQLENQGSIYSQFIEEIETDSFLQI